MVIQTLYTQWKDKFFQRTALYIFLNNVLQMRESAVFMFSWLRLENDCLGSLSSPGEIRMQLSTAHHKASHVERHFPGTSHPPALVTWQVLGLS